MWYVYIILCQKDNTLYTGITKDVRKRILAHEKGQGARYTKGRGPFKIIKIFPCQNKSDALRLEYQIKQLSRKQKLEL